MRWPTRVLTGCALLGLVFAAPGVVAHFDCVDEADESDPTGTIHLWSDGDSTRVYLESNEYPGLQTHGCFDENEHHHSQDQLLVKT